MMNGTVDIFYNGDIGMPKTYRDIFTEEEIKADKADILEMFRNGIPLSDMSSELGRTQPYIYMIRDELIAEESITIEEIEKARAKRKEMFPPAQGGIKQNKVRKPRVYTKHIERKAKSENNKEQVLQLIKKKKPVTDIGKELKLVDASVRLYISQLIEEKRISEDEIIWYKTDRSKKNPRIDRTTEQYLETKNKVLQMLQMGYKSVTIRKRLDLDPFDYEIYVDDLVKNQKCISYDEIKERRALKHLQNLQFVAARIKMGDSLTIIREKLDEYIDYNGATRLANELVEIGIITNEEIEANRITAQRNSYSKGKILSTEEQVKFIREKVFLGYTPKEIVDSDETASVSMHSALYQKRRMIAEGIISAEEAKRLMEEHKSELREEQYLADWVIIKAKTKQGLKADEIAREMSRSEGYINTVKKFVEGKKSSKKDASRINNLAKRAQKEEKWELDGGKDLITARKSLIQEIRKANMLDVLLDPKIYVLCFNLYSYHPEMIDTSLLEVIMKGLKLTQKPSDYDRYKNEIKSVIKNELKTELEISFDE